MAWPRTRDDLTRLLTRAAFTRDLGRQGLHSLLLLDLDHLKLLNDSLGHAAGDEQLRRLGQALRDHSPPGSRAYRLGGDEFALLSPLPPAALERWAQEFIEALAQRPDGAISVSGGAAPLGEALDPHEAVACADRRLYRAKRAGRGQVVSDDRERPFGTSIHRLLERDELRAQATTWLQGALSEPGELYLEAEPGGGLSAFMTELELIARNLGYRTLRVSGDPARRCRVLGAWQSARLDGQVLDAGVLNTGLLNTGLLNTGLLNTGVHGLQAPLALLLDTPERLDAESAAAVQALIGGAQAVIRGHADERRAGRPAPLLSLPPLSLGAVRELGLLTGEALAPELADWLMQRTGGRPAPLLKWLSALRLEAGLRRLSLAALSLQPTGNSLQPSVDWEEAVARHLPPSLSWPRPTLHGRHAELQVAAEALRHAPLLSITGPAGRGKTRFAEQLLGELGSAFSGGALAVSLAGVSDEGSALARIASALLGQGAETVTASSLGRVLARRPTLLLLDMGVLDMGVGSPVSQEGPDGDQLWANEQAPELPLGTAAVEALLSHSALTRLIVVASGPLGASGEVVLPLPLLAESEVRAAVRQVLSAQGAVSVTADGSGSSGSLAELLRWVGGEPQRLSAVLALLSSEAPGAPDLPSPPNSPGAANLPGAADPLARALETLRTAAHSEHHPAEYSAQWAVLGSDERRRLAALSSLAGPFTLGWAAQISGASGFLLGALRDQAYFQVGGGGHYELPAALFRAASAKLKRSPALVAEVVGRSLKLLHTFSAAPVPRRAAWFLQLDAQAANLRSSLAGLRLSAPGSDPAHWPGWAEVVLALIPYRLSRGEVHEARTDLSALLRLEQLDPVLRLRLRLSLVQVMQGLGEYDRAPPDLAALEPDHPLWPDAALIQARSLHRRSRYPQSAALYGQVAVHPARTGEQAVAGLNGQARSFIYLGQLEGAWTLIGQARAQASELNDPLLSAGVLNTAALIATEQRALIEADALFAEALELHRGLGDRAGISLNLTGLAWVTLLSGNADRSAELSRQVLRSAQDSGNTWELVNALINLGHALSLTPDLPQARSAYLDGVRQASQGDTPSLIAEALAGLAGLRARSDSAAAHTLLRLALTHPGANAECRQFFAPLAGRLAQYPPAPLHPEDAALAAELKLAPPITGR